jgi:hypothetical protein
MFKKDIIKKRFGRKIREVIKELSRNVKIITIETDSECPNCYIDTVTGKSSGVCKHEQGHQDYFKYGRCPICKGEGVIEHETSIYVSALVVWRGSTSSSSKENDFVFNDFGLAGRAVARLKTDVCNLNLFKLCDYVVVDGIKCTLYNPPIIRGLGGKHVLVVYVYSSDKLADSEVV